MPQMSPLGWAWMIPFIVFGFYFYMVMFFYIFKYLVFFWNVKLGLTSFFWKW